MLPQINNLSLPVTKKHENIKKRAYEQRVREIEHVSFTPLVMSLTGGLGNAATICYKRLASLLASKHEQAYCSTMTWLRCTLSFNLLCSSIRCIRGTRSASGHAQRQSLPPIDPVISEARLQQLSLTYYFVPPLQKKKKIIITAIGC